jgi:hypothetical protein
MLKLKRKEFKGLDACSKSKVGLDAELPAHELSQLASNQCSIFCIVIVVVGEFPAVRL